MASFAHRCFVGHKVGRKLASRGQAIAVFASLLGFQTVYRAGIESGGSQRDSIVAGVILGGVILAAVLFIQVDRIRLAGRRQGTSGHRQAGVHENPTPTRTSSSDPLQSGKGERAVLNGRAFLTACAVLLGLCVLTVVLNSIRWSYHSSAFVVVDNWTGRRFIVNQEGNPNQIVDTAKYVFGAAAVIVVIALTLAVVTKSRRPPADSCPPVTVDRHSEDSNAEPHPSKKYCLRCGREMKIEVGARGKFWSCTGLPNCFYSEDYVEPRDG
jgi:hypothetical protein